MGATQFNHGQQALELVEVAERNNWREVINPPSLPEAWTFAGRLPCAPVNIHSPQWMWVSPVAFEAAGLEPATAWEELKAAAPALREARKLRLALGMQGWQQGLLLDTLVAGLGGPEFYTSAFADGDEDVLRGDHMARIFAKLDAAREMSSGGNLSEWNLATARMIGVGGAPVIATGGATRSVSP